VWTWIGAGLLILVAAAAYTWWRRRSSAPELEDHAHSPGAGPGPTHEPADTIEGRRALAAAALVDTDDAIRCSQLELDVARSELGDDQVEPFLAALDRARGELDMAFTVAQLAHEGAGSDAERTQLEEITNRCQVACGHLDALVPRFDALRGLEARLDDLLASRAEDLAVLEDRLIRSTATTEALTAQFPRASTAGVVDDLEQARERLRFARTSITVGRDLLHGGDRRGAAARGRAVEESLIQATRLLASVDRAPQVLAKAQEAVSTLLRQTEKDIADAERLGVTDDMVAKGLYARETLGWADAEVGTGSYDPLEMRRALQDADLALGEALGPIRTDDDTQERALALLATTWYGARATVRAAEELITTRRAAVGLEARARISHARRDLATGTALGDSDPTQALHLLRSADALAYQARTLAQQDEAAWSNARRISSGTGALDGVLLGGILIEAPTPEGHPGTSPTGAGAPLGPPSFGGPATRARRVGSGQFEVA
jgi:hypothetical protein